MVKAKKWELRSIEHMIKISQAPITLSFKQLLEIDNHAFGTLELHCNEQTLSFGNILANDIKCALFITDLIRFKRGKITNHFFHFSFP